MNYNVSDKEVVDTLSLLLLGLTTRPIYSITGVLRPIYRRSCINNSFRTRD